MSRFPELQRVERAIKSKAQPQLRWALAYCESRLSLDTEPKLQKQWRDLLDRVRAALESLPRGG